MLWRKALGEGWDTFFCNSSVFSRTRSTMQVVEDSPCHLHYGAPVKCVRVGPAQATTSPRYLHKGLHQVPNSSFIFIITTIKEQKLHLAMGQDGGNRPALGLEVLSPSPTQLAACVIWSFLCGLGWHLSSAVAHVTELVLFRWPRSSPLMIGKSLEKVA